MKINAIGYKPLKYNKKALNNKDVNKNETQKTLNYNSCCALRNIVLFKGNINNKRMQKLEDFCKKYNLNFSDINLIDTALTSSSQSEEFNQNSSKLKWYGENVFDITIATMLYGEHENYSADKIFKILQKKRDNKNIAEYVKILNLKDLVEDAITERHVINCFKEFIGAIYLDDKNNGFDNVYNFINNYLRTTPTEKRNEYCHYTLPQDKEPDELRKAKLEDFCKKYNLNFSDINLIDTAFMFKCNSKMYSNECFNNFKKFKFLSDFLMKLSVEEILIKHLPKEKIKTLKATSIDAVNNNALSSYAKKLALDEMLYEADGAPSEKNYADIFGGLITAIFLNGQENGFKEVVKFLEDNLLEEILSTKETREKAKEAALQEKLERYKNYNFDNYKDIINKTANDEGGVYIDEKRFFKLIDFQEKFNLNFSDLHLLNKVFTNSGNDNYHKEYERIENIGVDVFKLCVTMLLMNKYPEFDEGTLSANRTQICKAENKLKYIKALGIKDMMYKKNILCYGERNYTRALNALIGAIYLNEENNFEGLNAAMNFISKNIQPLFPKETTSKENRGNSYTSEMKREIMKSKGDKPINIVFDEHNNKQRCSIYYGTNELLARATDEDKKKAEELAAQVILKKIEKTGKI